MNFSGGRLAGLSCVLMLPAAVSLALMSQTPAAAAPAAAFGPQVDIGEPSNGYVGQFDVSPTHAPAGASVALTAAGLPPGQEFQLLARTAPHSCKVTAPPSHPRD